MTPSLCVFMICKNEEKHIARAIRSVLPIASRLVIVDTGSTDNTRRVAEDAAYAVRLIFEVFTDASELEGGDWKLWDFGMARNHAIELAEFTGCTHLMWMDADDELVDYRPVRRALYRGDVDTFAIFIESSGQKWLHQRIWKTDKHVRFKGRVHEFPVIDGLKSEICYTTVRHDSEVVTTQENSNPRNLRILMRQWAEQPDARTAFYIGCTHRDGGRHAEAAKWFEKRLSFGDCYRDEMLFAALYLSRSLRQSGDEAGAEQALLYGEHLAPGWAEFVMERAFLRYTMKDFAGAIDIAARALDKPIIPTALWREPDKYRDQPARLISWCHEHMGNLAQAIVWSELAAERVGKDDPDWNARHQKLKAQFLAVNDPPPAIVKRKREQVALMRPGAIGDILMTLNLIPAFREQNPESDVHYYCAAQYAKPDALMPTMLAAGVNCVLDVAGFDAWRKNYDRVVELVGYPLAEGYPDKPMRLHLLHYFAQELGLPISPDLSQAALGLAPLWQLSLPRPERPDFVPQSGPYLTFQAGAGWSKYKQWMPGRFIRAIDAAIEGETPMILIDGKAGHTLAESIAAVANASMHVGIDSFCNHLTNYLWSDARGARRVPGVILWGSTQATAAGYPDNVNISLGLPCQPCFRENPAISRQPRGPCVNPIRLSYDDPTPWACMEGISVERVAVAVRELWEKTNATGSTVAHG